MPVYRVTAPDGRVLRLTGDSPPTQEELVAIFSDVAPGAMRSAAAAQGLAAARAAASSWLGDTATSALPALGGAVGGVLGFGAGAIPGAMAGAAVGGAGGEAWRQNINRVRGAGAPDTSGGAASDIAGAALQEGVVEGLGHGVGKVALGGGRALMENAIRTPIGMQRGFPNVVDTAIRERVPVGPRMFGAKKGSEIAGDLLIEESVAVKALLDKATAGGTNFASAKVAQPVVDLFREIGKESLTKKQEKRLTKMIEGFLEDHPGPLSPRAVQDLKQSAQAFAEGIYKARAAGTHVPARSALRARFEEKLAEGARKAMETIPGVGEKEARKQALIGLERALSQAELRRLSRQAETVTLGASVLGGLLAGNESLPEGLRKAALIYGTTRLAMSPRSLSRAGLVLTQKQVRGLLRQFPRLALYVLAEAGGDSSGPAIPDNSLGMPRP